MPLIQIPTSGLWGTIAGYLNSNYALMTTKIKNTTGHGFYMDSATELLPQPFTDGTKQKLACDKNFVNERLPDGVVSFFDAATQKFTPDQVDGIYGLNISCHAYAGTQDKNVLVEVESPNGIAPGVPLPLRTQSVRLAKGVGADNFISLYFATAASATMIANGLEVYLTFLGTNATVHDVSYQLVKLNAPLLP